jgi:hypothetical protein
VSLAALKFLHEKRHILFHGHEPLDTDMTPTLEGEHWLMHHGYTQAEGVANLDQVPETGCLVTIGYPKFKSGLGGMHATLPFARRNGDKAFQWVRYPRHRCPGVIRSSGGTQSRACVCASRRPAEQRRPTKDSSARREKEREIHFINSFCVFNFVDRFH